MLKVVSIGGFGHAGLVFNEISCTKEAGLFGFAPAYLGESVENFTRHRLSKGVEVYDDFETMLEEVKPDVAIISTRLDVIPKIIKAVAKTGCHIISEKPLALDFTTLQDVESVVERYDVRLMAMLSMRAAPPFVAAKRLYQRGSIGEAILVNARKSYKWKRRPEWMGEKAKYGGTIGWVGIHALDFTNFITGLEFRRVTAFSGNFSHPERPACDDHAVMSLELSNGGLASVSTDLCRPASALTHGDDWIRIVGTKGIVEVRGSDATCTIHTKGEKPVPVELPEKPLIFRDFLEAIARNDSTLSLRNASFMLTKVCLGAQLSAEQGTFVDLG